MRVEALPATKFEAEVVSVLREMGGWRTTEAVRSRLGLTNHAIRNALWAAYNDGLIDTVQLTNGPFMWSAREV